MQEPFVPLQTSITPENMKEALGVDPETLDTPPGFGETNPVMLSFVLDFSLKHLPDTRRYIDVAKEQLVSIFVGLEEDDRVHVHPTYGMLRKSKAVAAVSGYQMNPFFVAQDALKLSLEAISREDPDCRKILFYITDRSLLKYDYIGELILRQHPGCEVCLMVVSDRYDESLPSFKARLVKTDVMSICKTVQDILKE